jgi:hypothetical protein
MKPLLKKSIFFLALILLVNTISYAQCGFTNMFLSTTSCIDTTNTFILTGTVEFQNPPLTGLLTITDCNGNADTLYPPFISPANYSLEPVADSSQNCTVTALFTAEPICLSSWSTNYPTACICVADVGTFSTNISSNNQNIYQLCFGDQFTLTSNGDFVPPNFANSPPLGPPEGYNPGIGYLIYWGMHISHIFN